MIKNIRRKLAKKIDPEPKSEYPLVEIGFMTPERDKELSIQNHHMNFERDNGYKASSDEQATAYTKKKVEEIMAKIKEQEDIK